MRFSRFVMTRRFPSNAWFALFLASIAISGQPVLAQLPTATISGTVKDSSGAVVANATLTVTNMETGLSRSGKSGNDGSYRFPALPVGTYEVRAEQTGFQSRVQSGLRVTVGEESVINFALEVGAVTETVSVTAEAPIVNTTSGSLGGLVSEQKVTDLPLDGRNYNDLTFLQTGVVAATTLAPPSASPTSVRGTPMSSNGAPVRSNTFMIDGTIMNDMNNIGAGSANNNTLGVEGIREFRVVTNAFSAEYGGTMGSQIMLVTKSGTNRFHGSVFEFLRNSDLDARNWTDVPNKPGFRRNNFGASGGGPIKRDKTFFFLTYEGLRQGLGKTFQSTVPTLEARQDGGLVQTIFTPAKPYLALYPAPNGPGLGGGLATYYSAGQEVQSEEFGQARIDHNFSGSDSLFGRYTIDRSSDFSPGPFPPVSQTTTTRPQWLTLSEDHIFSPALLNTFRASYSRANYLGVPIALSTPSLVFVPGQPIGSLGISGVTDLSSGAGSPQVQAQRVISGSDDLFYTRGRHSFKMGALIQRYRQYMEVGTNVRGSWAFPNLASFLQGQANSFTVLTPGSIDFRTYGYYTMGFYLQDDLRATPRLTLNLGLRYEFNTQYTEANDHGAAIRDVQHDADVTLGIPFQNPSLHNFGPRIGFAWDATGDGKTSLRGGFGLLYDVGIFGAALLVGTTGTPPLSTTTTLTRPVFGPLPVIPASAAGKTLRTVDYNMHQPHLLSYNLTMERRLPFDMGLTVAYAGSRGINLQQIVEGNPTVPRGTPVGRQACVAAIPPPAFVANGPKCWLGNDPRTNPNWSNIEFHTAGGNSWYNSLQVGLLKRLTRGLQFQSSYTWSHVLDETQGAQGADDSSAGGNTADDPSNRRYNKGSASFDFRHQWHFNALYNFPSRATGGTGKLLNGWWVSGILSWNSGFAFTPALGTQRSRSQVGGPNGGIRLPDLVPGTDTRNITRGTSRGCLGIPAGTRLGTPQLFFDPCAFSIPPLGFLGTSPRSVIYGPNFSSVNFSLVKDTPLPRLGESARLQFRAEIFNILNHPDLGIPQRTVYAGTQDVQAPLANVGQITSTLSKSREIQFALKILF